MTPAVRDPIRAPAGLAAALLCFLLPSGCTNETGLLPGSDDIQSVPDTDTHPPDSGSADFDFYREIPPCGPAEVWCPGDPIPGWVSLEPDLSELEGKPIVEISQRPVHLAFGMAYECGSTPDCHLKYSLGSVQSCFGEMGDGQYFESTGSCHFDDTEVKWYLAFGLHTPPPPADPEDLARFQGLGWYDARCDTYGDETYGYDTYSLLELGPDWSHEHLMTGCDVETRSDGWYVVPGRTFLSELRPDRIRGVAYIDLTELEYYQGEKVVYLLNFDVPIPIHGGLVNGGYRAEDVPFPVHNRHAGYLDDTHYDTDWPWDIITDPGIRDRIYRLYQPYGMEWVE